MNEQQFRKLVEESHEYLTKQNDQCVETYKLGTYGSYDLDQASGEMVFGDDGIAKVLAKFQFVGSYSAATQKWMWAWANPSINELVRQQVLLVRDFGQKNEVIPLAAPAFDARESDGWTLAAIMSKIVSAKGGYRIPADPLFHFVLFTEIDWAPDVDPKVIAAEKAKVQAKGGASKRRWYNWFRKQ